MHIIVCLDDKNGMMFNGRRQSQDSVLRNRVSVIADGSRLMMNEYSKKQFTDVEDICVDENFLKNADRDDVCFVENLPLSEIEERIDTITVFRWNRVYPSDKKFDIDLNIGWKLVESRDFAGSSHEKITEEVYER